MDKQQIISFIETQLKAGKISKQDLANVANEEYVSTQSAVSSIPLPSSGNIGTSNKLITVFYVIGAIIILIGVIILLAQYWEDIGFLGRVLVTLGIGCVMYMAGLLLSKTMHNAISQILFTISAVLAPMGVLIIIDEGNMNFTFATQTFIALGFAIVYAGALFIARKAILVLIVTAFMTWAYYAFLLNLLGENIYDFDWLKWATMLIGFTYLFIGYGYQRQITDQEEIKKEYYAVSQILYFFGTIAVLGAGISIGGIWDLIFILFIFGAFYLSAYVKSGGMLLVAALFLMAHIIKLTSEYFSDSLSWPLMLILCGFMVMGVGYITFYINKKFIKSSV